MLKLLTCLFAAIAIGVAVLQTRQQHLEINHQINTLHNQIESHQARLWSQQLQIAVYSGNPSIAKTIEANSLPMVPATTPADQANPNGAGTDRPTFTALAR